MTTHSSTYKLLGTDTPAWNNITYAFTQSSTINCTNVICNSIPSVMDSNTCVCNFDFTPLTGTVINTLFFGPITNGLYLLYTTGYSCGFTGHILLSGYTNGSTASTGSTTTYTMGGYNMKYYDAAWCNANDLNQYGAASNIAGWYIRLQSLISGSQFNKLKVSQVC